MGENTVVILHNYGARTISLLFYGDQGTENEYWEIKMSTNKPIFTHKIISKALLDNNIHTILKDKKKVW